MARMLYFLFCDQFFVTHQLNVIIDTVLDVRWREILTKGSLGSSEGCGTSTTVP